MTSRLITRFRGLHIPQRPLHQSALGLNEFRRTPATRYVEPPIQITENLTLPELNRIRTVPSLNTFYGGNPVHDDNMNKLRTLVTKYRHLPRRVLSPEEINSIKFISFAEYTEKTKSGTRVRKVHYNELIALLHKLRTIDLQLMPKPVMEILDSYTGKTTDRITENKKSKTLDDMGRAKGKAKRKLAQAKVYLVKGDGQVLINGRSIVEFFPNVYARKSVTYPFQVIDQEGQYNVFARVSGGGFTGKSEAIMYAIAKALIVFNPLLKPRLSRAGLMTSDTRIVERKKPGKLKARKSPTWVKR
jgi:small subunit ribosomal protein S9